jgi:hypothetical protein
LRRSRRAQRGDEAKYNSDVTTGKEQNDDKKLRKQMEETTHNAQREDESTSAEWGEESKIPDRGNVEI